MNPPQYKLSSYSTISIIENPEFHLDAIRTEWHIFNGRAFTKRRPARTPLNPRVLILTFDNGCSDIEILRDLVPTGVARMLRAPGFLPESLILNSTNTRLVVVGRGTGFHRGLCLGGRVGDADTKIETTAHGLAEIERCARAEADADFFGHFIAFLALASCGGSEDQLWMDMWD